MDEQQAPLPPEPAAAPEPSAYGSREELDTPFLVLAGVVFAVVVFLAIFYLQGLFYRMQKTEITTRLDAERPQQLSDLRAQQQARLNSYSWIDRPKGIISIPIDEAMRIELERLQQAQTTGGKPAPAAVKSAK